ncbi:MAG: ATP-dependent sacrificial sulfur transferase LarE [Bacteroidales bacterium]|nr:ATP-dependent sacrificial sulfur transferase LarE [Bacteroidales bacterium]
MNKALQKKYDELKQIVGSCPSVAVAFSGGVDSTLLLKVCRDVLRDKCIAIFSDSVLQPAREKEATLTLAREIGTELVILEGIDLKNDAFRKNPHNRCYLCKGIIFDQIMQAAAEKHIDCIFDGSNMDDLSDYRPGKKALNERGIRSPLQEAGLTKAEIRVLSKELGLPTWDKDALACLATRIAYHEEITQEKLLLIDRIESWLVQEGFRNVRARFQDQILSIEVRKEQIPLLKKRIAEPVIENLLGDTVWKQIIIDQKGYQQGKMNQKIVSSEKYPEQDEQDSGYTQ